MKNLTRLAAAGLVLLAAGCAAVTKIDPGRVTIDNAYTVETAIEWARLKHGRTHLWTVDGPLLQELRFVTAIGEGDPIFDSDRARNMPRFTDSMTELEIVDFFRASIAALEVSDFRPSDFRPAAFGDRPGFRFELATFRSRDWRYRASRPAPSSTVGFI